MIARTPTASAVYSGLVAYVPTGEAALRFDARRNAEGYARYMRESADVALIAQRVAQLLGGRDVGDSEDIESVFQHAADELGLPFEPVPSDVMLTGRKVTYTGMRAVRRDGSPIDGSAALPAGLPVVRSGARDITRADGSVPVQAGEVAYVFGASARQSWWDKYWSVVVVVAVAGGLFALAAVAAAGAGGAAAATSTAAGSAGGGTAGAAGAGAGVLGTVSQVAGVASVGAGVTQAIRQALTDPPPVVAPPMQQGIFGNVPLWAWLGVGLAAVVLIGSKGGRS